MHINKSNYFSEINKIGVGNLTPTLAQGHTMIEKITKNGASWDVASSTFESVIENHLKLFNAFADKKGKDFMKSHVIVARPEPLKEASIPVTKGDTVWDTKLKKTAKVVKVSKPAKDSALKDEPFVMNLEYANGKKSINMAMGERFTLNLPAEPQTEGEVNKNPGPEKKKTSKSRIQKPIAKEKRIKKSPKVAAKKRVSIKEIKPPVTVKKFSLELQHIKRYLNMEGKSVKTSSLERLSSAISKAMTLDSYLTHKTLLSEISRNLIIGVEKLKETGQLTVDVKLAPEFKSKCKEIVSEAKVRVRTEYLAGTEEDCDCEKKK